jgi:hypothetical protein
MTAVAETKRAFTTKLAYSMLRGRDSQGLRASQVKYLVSCVDRAYPDTRRESGSWNVSWKTVTWHDGTSEWSLGWWSRSGGGGNLTNQSAVSLREGLASKLEKRADHLKGLQEYLEIVSKYGLKDVFHSQGTQLIDMVKHWSQASNGLPSLRRQIIWYAEKVAAVDAQREAAESDSLASD